MRIYFMGVCGSAMGNAALLMRQAGHEVLGADTGVYPPMSTLLHEAGVDVLDGYDAKRLEGLKPDLVVVGNAISRGNPEVEWLLDTRAIRYTSLPALLHDQLLSRRMNIVVAGTHGKTTTTAIAAFLLRENGRDPGFLIGGVPLDPPVGTHLGAPDAPFVIEGDEYDSAFFDKRSKFIHYAPRVAVLNNLEFDHADIFRDLADVERTFLHFCRIVPKSGFIVVNGDDLNIRSLGDLGWTRVVRVGTGAANDVVINDFNDGPGGSGFFLTWHGKDWAHVQWKLHGIFNARNAAMAAVASQLALLPPGAEIGQLPVPGSADALSLECLSRFRGVKRRQEVLAHNAFLSVIEDFGHHPTAIAETLRSLRARFAGRILTAVFEPRSNTARTKILQTGFSRALSEADEVYIGEVSRAGKLAVGDRFDSEAVVGHLQSQDVDAWAFDSNAALLDALKISAFKAAGEARVVVFFSNGSFDGIIPAFAKAASGE